MKSFFPILLFCILSIAGAAQSPDEVTIRSLNRNWLQSIVTRDTATLSNILAEDFVLISPTGRKQTRADNLENLLQNDFVLKSIVVDSTTFRILTPDVGLISAWTSFVYSADGKESAGKNCYQDVYMKRNGKWVAVSAHVTLLGSIR